MSCHASRAIGLQRTQARAGSIGPKLMRARFWEWGMQPGREPGVASYDDLGTVPEATEPASVDAGDVAQKVSYTALVGLREPQLG